MTLSRGRDTTVNKLNPRDVVSERWNTKRLDRGFANHARRARARRGNRRISNQLVSTILRGRKSSHVLVKDCVELHVFVTHVAQYLARHLSHHAYRGDVLGSMTLLGVT